VGPLFAGLIKILPVFIIVLSGLLAYMLASTGQLDVTSLTDAEGSVDSKGIYAGNNHLTKHDNINSITR
jgi:SSS family solute:Na+ symporter